MASSQDRQIPSDRRMRRRRPSARPSDRRMQAPADQKTRRIQRLVIGGILAVIIAGIVGFGYYEVFVKPNQVLAARVGDVRYTQGELVKRMRMEFAALSAGGQDYDFGSRPFEVLISMADAEIVRRFAADYNVHVTDDDIEFGLRERFYPRIPADQEVSQGQADQEYREAYGRFLSNSHMSDGDYRRIVSESIYREKLRVRLGELVPSVGEQYEVHWVRLPQDLGGGGSGLPGVPGAPTDPVVPSDIRERLLTEDFAAVAQEVGRPAGFADREGYVGWLPRNAFPFLDDVVFGGEGGERLALNEISGLLFDEEANNYLVKITAGPEVRTIDPNLRQRMTDQSLEDWLREKKSQGAEEGWLELNFSQELYEWVNDRVKEVAPPTGE